MSFQDAITRKKSNLNPTETKFTRTDGSVFIESRVVGGFEKFATGSVTQGFVVDLKPDLDVAKLFPWLFLGSQDVACDETLLQSHGITHILSVGVEAPHFDGVQYDYVEALDVPEFNLINAFNHCYHIIESVRLKNGRIFVHCNAGISRSCSVVTAYLMKYNRCSLDEALEAVKSVRPCARPNPGFIEQLRNHESSVFQQ